MRKLLLTLCLSLPILATGTGISSCSDSNKVYICTGKNAKVYHNDRNCKGLNRCSRAVKAITLDEAKRMGRRECKICY